MLYENEGVYAVSIGTVLPAMASSKSRWARTVATAAARAVPSCDDSDCLRTLGGERNAVTRAMSDKRRFATIARLQHPPPTTARDLPVVEVGKVVGSLGVGAGVGGHVAD